MRGPGLLFGLLKSILGRCACGWVGLLPEIPACPSAPDPHLSCSHWPTNSKWLHSMCPTSQRVLLLSPWEIRRSHLLERKGKHCGSVLGPMGSPVNGVQGAKLGVFSAFCFGCSGVFPVSFLVLFVVVCCCCFIIYWETSFLVLNWVTDR